MINIIFLVDSNKANRFVIDTILRQLNKNHIDLVKVIILAYYDLDINVVSEDNKPHITTINNYSFYNLEKKKLLNDLLLESSYTLIVDGSREFKNGLLKVLSQIGSTDDGTIYKFVAHRNNLQNCVIPSKLLVDIDITNKQLVRKAICKIKKSHKSLKRTLIRFDFFYTTKRMGQYNKGVSVVTCCMDRNSNLVKSVKSWTGIKGVNEIVVIDWNSVVPVSQTLKLNGIKDDRIKIYRVHNVRFWVASWAKTFGYEVSSFDKILFVDADDQIDDPHFLKKHPLPNSVFYGGTRGKQYGGKHLYGMHYVHKSSLERIGGQHQYITTYGYEDTDLFNRLAKSGLKRKNFNLDKVQHLTNNDDEIQRTVNQLIGNKYFARRLNMKVGNRIIWNKTYDRCVFRVKPTTSKNYNICYNCILLEPVYMDNKLKQKIKYKNLVKRSIDEMRGTTRYPDSRIDYCKKADIIPTDFDAKFYKEHYNLDFNDEHGLMYHWLFSFNTHHIYNSSLLDRLGTKELRKI
jgi:hypothetical protein